MGIKSLTKFLRETYPEIFDFIHLSEYSFKKVAIDTSLYLCQYKALYGEDGWLNAFIKLVACLRENEIHCVFIYDSGYPPEKEIEKRERNENRKKMEERVINLEVAIDTYRDTGEVDPILVEFQNQKKITNTRLLSATPNVTFININSIEYQVKKMRKQLFSITPNDFAITKQLFDILHVPYFQAPLEAETMCSDLCKQGKVDAVLTEDSDVLAYSSPIFLTKINSQESSCIRIRYTDVLEKMELSEEEFLDFCIMCGTDYNKNIFRIGPAKAHKLIKEHKTIEAVQQMGLDISVLNHVRSRELFLDYKRSDVYVPYCGTPDFDALREFVVKRNLRVNIDSLRKSFMREFVVEE